MNTSAAGIIYHACTTTHQYQWAHEIWSASLHLLQKNMTGAPKSKMDHVTMTTILSGVIWIGNATINLSTKFEMSIITGY